MIVAHSRFPVTNRSWEACYFIYRNDVERVQRKLIKYFSLTIKDKIDTPIYPMIKC